MGDDSTVEISHLRGLIRYNLSMKYKSFAHMNCSVAQSLEILGERWTLLILRDAFLGTRKFEDFLGTGISRNVLATRLKRLVEEDILEKRPIDGKSSEYRLTMKGLDLQPVLLSLMHWGDQHLPHPAGDRLIFRERETGRPIARMSAYSQDGQPLAPREIRATAGPGLKQD